jgi:hypothetical protein
VMPHPVFPNAGDDEHAVRAARMRKPSAGGGDELAQGGGTGPEALRSVQRRGLLPRARTGGFVAGGGTGEVAGAAKGCGHTGTVDGPVFRSGLYLVWRHTPVARKQLADWNATQDRIYRVLKPFGADPKARDAARVIRISGTRSSKNGAIVRLLGDASEGVYRFKDLVKALVKNPTWEDEEERGKPGTDLYSLAVQRAARGLRNHPQGWSETSLWEGRLTDLQHRRRTRYGEGPMEDFRDRWLFIATTAISWLVVPEVLDREAFALAEEAGGWDERRTRSDLSQVLKRARRAVRDEKIELKGREWDPRHHFRNETIIEWLEITPQEEREMVVTISAEEESRCKCLRDREYQETRRRAKGVATRAQYDTPSVLGAPVSIMGSGLSHSAPAFSMLSAAPML